MTGLLWCRFSIEIRKSRSMIIRTFAFQLHIQSRQKRKGKWVSSTFLVCGIQRGECLVYSERSAFKPRRRAAFVACFRIACRSPEKRYFSTKSVPLWQEPI